MIHYHGTPISPNEIVIKAMAGRHFCVSFLRRDQIQLLKVVGSSLMFDNGAFTAWRTNKQIDWTKYYRFIEENINLHNDWAVIPDVINGSEEQNNALIDQWPLGKKLGAPVWHINESYKRLHTLAYNGYPRICFGSSGKYSKIGTFLWLKRIEDAFNILCPNGGQPPIAIHMLRGLSLAGSRFPFSSADSSNVARNHNRFSSIPEIIELVNRIEGANCPYIWQNTSEKLEAFNKGVCNYDQKWSILKGV